MSAVFGYHRWKKEQRTVFLPGAETSAAPGFAIYPTFCFLLLILDCCRCLLAPPLRVGLDLGRLRRPDMIYLLSCFQHRVLAIVLAPRYRQSSDVVHGCPGIALHSTHFSSRDSLRRQRDGDYKNEVHLILSALSGRCKNRFCFD